ncbi:MAG: hypothetical protein HQ536_04485 [Parcubacteria group bacterium]|nr:hypothetical protein [Parcubacteria group bacterium]
MQKTFKKRQKFINLFDSRERERLPFNWCDKWCERCDKSYKCRIFQNEQERAVKHSAEGRNPDDPEVFMEDMKEDFEKMHEMIKKDMKKHGMDYKKIMKEVEKMEVDFTEPPEFEITRKADAYMNQTRLLIEVLWSRMQFNPYLLEKIKNDVEVLNWYHTILPVKIRRVLDCLWETKMENGEDDELSLRDAYWTSDIVSKSINLSKQALENIVVHEPGSENTANNILVTLKEIEDELVKILDVALGKHLELSVNRKSVIYNPVIV